MELQRIKHWAISLCLWIISIGMIYVGSILVILAPVLGPRGNIDYQEFSIEKQKCAKTVMYLTVAGGVVVLAASGGILWNRKRIVLRLLKGCRRD